MQQHNTLTSFFALAFALVLCATPSAASIIQIPAGSNPDANCDAIIDQIAAIVAPSSNNAYQLQLEPGRYRCNGKKIVMKEWVDIIGTSIETTVILGSGDDDALANGNVLIRGANNAQLRDLRVEMNNPIADSVGVFIYEAETRLDNVDVLVQNGGASYDCTGILVRADSGEGTFIPWKPILRNGFYEAKACKNTYGVTVRGAMSPRIRRSYIMATHASIGVLAGNHNIGLLFLETDFLKNSNNIRLRDVEIGAYGLTGDNAKCYGIGFMNVEHIWKLEFYTNRITADKCSNGNAAIDVDNPVEAKHNLYFYDSQLKAAKGVSSYNDVGILANGNKVFVEVYGGSIQSDGATIEALSNSTVKVGGARLAGTSPAGAVSCAGVYDGTFRFFEESCP